jgi:hypothetical protein
LQVTSGKEKALSHPGFEPTHSGHVGGLSYQVRDLTQDEQSKKNNMQQEQHILNPKNADISKSKEMDKLLGNEKGKELAAAKTQEMVLGR